MEATSLQFVELSREWEISAQRKALIEQIKQKLLPNDSVEVKSAICLGLGNIENAQLCPLPSHVDKPETTRSNSVPVSWEDEYPSDDDDESESMEPVGHGRPRNYPLYQLIVFETVLDCLREKFTIDDVRFQDPKFTTADRNFLEQRGHTVLPYPDHDDFKPKPCDSSLLGHISSSTLFFAPALDRPVVVEVICAGRPSLYLGDDLLEDLARPYLLNPDMETFHLMEAFERFVLSRDFTGVAAFGSADLGFMWPADLTDDNEMGKLQTRWLKAELAKAKWKGWEAERVKAKSGAASGTMASGNTVRW